MLWAPAGHKALAYLRQRGLQDETIRHARLGYHAVERREPRESWGINPEPRKPTVWLPSGIVFPWYIGPELWRITIRRVGKDLPKETRYVTVAGSGNTLYGAFALHPDAPAAMVEGVLDALSLSQEAGDLVAVVATGSTTGGRLERWVCRLALASTVLVAFDADGAGEEAAAWWLQALGSQAKRWRPYWDDPSAMLQDGADLRTWVREGLNQGPRWWRELARWPEDRRETWAERAAILEMEGGFVRHEAELTAFLMASPTTGIL
jgi:DNA primase